jgi:2-polyprenyl-3-methyl-5-hydroxy-6-metoxy-1,4-benzoquinol methylase
MRTAADFDHFYRTPDPWSISRADFRDKIFQRLVSKFTFGKSVLELGCGEGHLTQAIFNDAKSVSGIDLSEVAIDRAKARAIPNAQFRSGDFLNISFEGFDVITAIECLYYLTSNDQATFFDKITREHRGKILIISGPIIGQNEHREYFTHSGLLATFAQRGISIVESHNLNVYRRGMLSNIVAVLVRLPFSACLLDFLPDSLIYQRCYIIRIM